MRPSLPVSGRCRSSELAAHGYKKIRIVPVPGGTLTHAEGYYISAYGKISSSWRSDGEKAVFEMEIPANTTAEISLPADLVEAGKIRDTYSGKIAGEKVTFTVGSGSYRFE